LAKSGSWTPVEGPRPAYPHIFPPTGGVISTFDNPTRMPGESLAETTEDVWNKSNTTIQGMAHRLHFIGSVLSSVGNPLAQEEPIRKRIHGKFSMIKRLMGHGVYIFVTSSAARHNAR
jgi:hypothetical protein